MTRLNDIDNILASMEWLKVTAELQGEINLLTERLISQNNDEIRGKIKALKSVVALKDTLKQERDNIILSITDN